MFNKNTHHYKINAKFFYSIDRNCGYCIMCDADAPYIVDTLVDVCAKSIDVHEILTTKL